jgi:hypothetical protein
MQTEKSKMADDLATTDRNTFTAAIISVSIHGGRNNSKSVYSQRRSDLVEMDC